MCLDKSFKTRQEARNAFKNPLIAKNDIEVYKVLTEQNTSPFRHFTYTKGFHYYQDEIKPFTKRIEEWAYKNWKLRIYDGLHAYLNFSAADRTANHYFEKRKIVKMVIPKGSKYFISDCGNEIVADNLIWYN